MQKSVQVPLGLRGANSPVLEQPATASCRLLLTQDRAGVVTLGRRVVAVACCTEGRQRPVHTVHFCLLLSSQQWDARFQEVRPSAPRAVSARPECFLW